MPNPDPAAAVMGALVADAAAMGLHWLYDPARIAEIVGDGSAAFIPPDPAHYENTPAYFAHGARANGQFSQYGEVLMLAVRSIARQGAFKTESFQQDYATHFGAGGTYQGYIDRPTRGTLENLAAGQTNPSGVDDDQHPAIATLPAVVAWDPGRAMLDAHMRDAISVTNVNDTATRYGLRFGHCLADVLSGQPLRAALQTAAKDMDDLTAALETAETDPVAYGAVTERACHLPQGMPLSFHILANTASYAEAVETNIRAGGDSCGRAIIIGALAGAAYGADAIPMDWTLSLQDAAEVWSAVQAL
ncbi:MAG: ADP-ribosylglycohydrolase family protein [Pseudomonadota bacterium]